MKKFIVLSEKVLNVDEIVAVGPYNDIKFHSIATMKTCEILLTDTVKEVIYKLRLHESDGLSDDERDMEREMDEVMYRKRH